MNGIDLRALDASPLHKDLFVVMDYMERTTRPTAVRTVWLWPESPPPSPRLRFKNPDGRPGIAIHLMTGNKVDYQDDLIHGAGLCCSQSQKLRRQQGRRCSTT